MPDVTLADLIAALNDGALTILHRPEWMHPQHMAWLHLANAGDVNAAIAFAEANLSGRERQVENWMWHLGYDNQATLTNRGDPCDQIRVISLSPAHALALASLQALSLR